MSIHHIASSAGAALGPIKKVAKFEQHAQETLTREHRIIRSFRSLHITGEMPVIRSSVIAVAIFVGLVTSANAQDAAAGEKAFVVCRACHQIGPGAKVAVGPVLNGIVGRKAGTYPGFTYSDANKNSGLTWSAEELNTYLENPQKVIPHTKMVFPGLKSEQQRKDVIAYLAQFKEDGSKN